MLKNTLFFILLCINIPLFGQGIGINANGNSADPSAILDVSSTEKGILIPRMTEAQRNAISSPAIGLMVFQTDNEAAFYFWNGTAWERVGKKAQPAVEPVPSSAIVLSKTYDNTSIKSGGFTYIGKTSLSFAEVIGNETIAGDTWKDISSVCAPSARWSLDPVWTGSEMIIWGGSEGTQSLIDGARYDPLSNSWTPISTTNAIAQNDYISVWTGTEMIIWGGGRNGTLTNEGLRYNPATDTWKSMSTVNAPEARFGTIGNWTGTELIVWGGLKGPGNVGGNYLNTGGKYDPKTDTWTTITMTNAPSKRYDSSKAWTGTELLVWGGAGPNSFVRLGTGARYNPTTDTWTAMSNANNPGKKHEAAFAWTGSKFIVWGGYSIFQNNLSQTGGIYDPTTDTWESMSTTNAPSPRVRIEGIWTGQMLLIWGGKVGHSINVPIGDGKRYIMETTNLPQYSASTKQFHLYEKD